MSRSDSESHHRTEPEPNGLDATDLDVRRHIDAPAARSSLERDRAREALHEKLFGYSVEPVRVGRFVLGERLGAGAMGIVYAAHDPRLDRKVAVKLVHPQADPDQHKDNLARLLREAQALARLTHPNVVTVHEVGEADDGLFIAMQFVDGSNLGTWLASHARPWRDVLRLFFGAGAGLAAAHRDGLVHRDFKPDNVLVDANDHPRVADFGLACPLVEADRTFDGDLDTAPSQLRLTQTGAVVGTPGYMAPELFAGRPADALSDQYAFCVALYEALYGVRPFAGKTLAALRQHADSMQLTAPLEGRDAPAWLHRAVVRGLNPDPQERFASMDALLSALERGMHRRRRLATAALAGVAGTSVVVATLSYGASTRQAADPPATPCRSTEALLGSLWPGGSRDALATAFEADARAFVRSFADATLGRLDAWADAWVEGRSDACRATHDRGEQSAALMDLRVQCYELAATNAQALVAAIARGRDAISEAPQTIGALPDLRLCADPEWVQAGRPLPRGADARERIEAAGASLAKARVLVHSGRAEEALAIAQATQTEAANLEYPPLAANALRLAATAYDALGKPAEAETALGRAMTESLGSGDAWGAAAAATDLIWYVGADGGRKAERERWTTVAEGIITKLGSPADLVGGLAQARAQALRIEGDATAALTAAESALALYTDFYGDNHTNTAAAHEEVAVALNALDRPDEGIEHMERALEIERKIWGAGHPRVGESLINFGILQGQMGRIEASAVALEEALDVLEGAHGVDSVQIVVALSNLALARQLQNRHEDALALNARARAIRERVYGPDHVEVAVNLANGGSMLTLLGRHDEALRWLQPALKIRTEKLGASHPAAAHVHSLLGDAHRARGELSQARKHYSRAVEIWSEKLGADHSSVGLTRVNLGEVLVGEGQRKTGLQQMRRGLDVVVAALGEDHPDAEVARQQLAHAEAVGRAPG